MSGAPQASAQAALAAPALRFWALVPARLGAQRLPGKPLADLGGLPLVVHAARRAAASGAEQVVVCTDEARIVEACTRHGVRALLTDSAHPTGTDRLAEACRALALADDMIVVNVQGDEPFMPPEVIRHVAAALQADPGCDLATAAHPLTRAAEFFDPNVVKVVVDSRGRALLFSRAPIPWSRDAFGPLPMRPGTLPAELPALRHVGIYAYRAGFLQRFPTLARPPLERQESLEQLRALYHGSAVAVMRLDAPLPPGIDTPEDLERARHALAGAQRQQPHGTSG